VVWGVAGNGRKFLINEVHQSRPVNTVNRVARIGTERVHHRNVMFTSLYIGCGTAEVPAKHMDGAVKIKYCDEYRSLVNTVMNFRVDFLE
jgi:hypothetical protein